MSEKDSWHEGQQEVYLMGSCTFSFLLLSDNPNCNDQLSYSLHLYGFVPRRDELRFLETFPLSVESKSIVLPGILIK